MVLGKLMQGGAESVDFDRNIWAFDTSGLNSLFDEPEKHSFLEMFRTTVVPAISVLNLLVL